MKTYIDLVSQVLNEGELRKNRTGVETLSTFGVYYQIDLNSGFPLLTTKKVNFPAVIHELLWYLSGETHIRDLKNKTKIWNAWTSEEKNWSVGNLYGYQWVNWEQYNQNPKTGVPELKHINQIQKVIELIKEDPMDRRQVVSAWNPADLYRPENDPKKPALPSCHLLFMFYVTNSGKLNCHLTQRSADLMLGVPFNLACYASLTQMIAQECNLEAGKFSHYMNDCHIYTNHIEGAKVQIKREPGSLPNLEIARKPFWEIGFEDFVLTDYDPHSGIKFPIAV